MIWIFSLYNDSVFVTFCTVKRCFERMAIEIDIFIIGVTILTLAKTQ